MEDTLPCRPETISTTSSYTIRVAALSGSRSRLMEENTGTQINTTKCSYYVNGQNKYTQSEKKQAAAIYLATLMIAIRHNKSLNHLYKSLIFLLCIPSAVQDTSLTQQTALLSSSFLPFTPPLFRAGKRDNPIGRRSVGS